MCRHRCHPTSVRPGREELTALFIDRAHTELGATLNGPMSAAWPHGRRRGPWLRLGGNHAVWLQRRRRPLVGLQPGLLAPRVPPCPKGRVSDLEGGIATAATAGGPTALGADCGGWWEPPSPAVDLQGLAPTSRRWQVERVRSHHSQHAMPSHARHAHIPPIHWEGWGFRFRSLFGDHTSVVITKQRSKRSCRAYAPPWRNRECQAAIRSFSIRL